MSKPMSRSYLGSQAGISAAETGKEWSASHVASRIPSLLRQGMTMTILESQSPRAGLSEHREAGSFTPIDRLEQGMPLRMRQWKESRQEIGNGRVSLGGL